MKQLVSAALLVALLGACKGDAGPAGPTGPQGPAGGSGTGTRIQLTGTLDALGNASRALPAEAGSVSDLPILACYVANPAQPAAQRAWFQIGSVQLPPDVPTADDPSGVLSNCILEADAADPTRLRASLEGETPGWLYAFVVLY